ncbi:MAG: acyl-homoserine-lactone synthase [Pseudomonadota bacterium]
MLQVFDGTDELKKAGLYEKMWVARYQVFVQDLGWSLPHKNQKEKDLYDTPEAIYLVNCDGTGNIVSSARLLPTTMPFLMDEIFGYLIDPNKIVPKGQTVLELTRYFINPKYSSLRDVQRLSGEIFCGVMEYCVEEAITSLLIVMDTRFLPQLQEIGWDWRPLGLPREFGGGPNVHGGGHALAVEVLPSEAALQASTQRRNVALPNLIRSDTNQPQNPTNSAH